MKGKRTLVDYPFRYGGFFHNYEDDCDSEWFKNLFIPRGRRRAPRCYCCGGIMGNCRSIHGTLLKREFPYCGEYKITKGKNKGRFHFKIICRSCAYAYGRGVIEVDGETYKEPWDFNESKWKAERAENSGQGVKTSMGDSLRGGGADGLYPERVPQEPAVGDGNGDRT